MKQLTTFVVAAAAAFSVSAQEFPSKPITFVVPFAPGPTDTVARQLAETMRKHLGMVFKTPVKPEWRERGTAGTMAT